MPSNKEDNSKNKGCTLINGLIEKKISVLGCMNINLLYDIILLKDWCIRKLNSHQCIINLKKKFIN